jgi:hypothetical protein
MLERLHIPDILLDILELNHLAMTITVQLLNYRSNGHAPFIDLLCLHTTSTMVVRVASDSC